MASGWVFLEQWTEPGGDLSGKVGHGQGGASSMPPVEIKATVWSRSENTKFVGKTRMFRRVEISTVTASMLGR